MAQVTVTAQYVADTTAYVNSVRRATEATNQFAQSLPRVDQAQSQVKASTVALGAALGTVGAMVFAKASGALQKYAMQGIQAAKDYEQTVISIEGIFAGTGMSMQSAAKKTETYLADLRDFAAKTPFELPQTLDAVKRLLSIGYAADDVKDRMLPAIGDIVAALGQPPSSISAVVYAFGQMKSAGRVLSQDLMQIGNALPGFNAKMALANELFQGDFGALTKAMETGSLDSSKAIDVIITAMTKFGGAAGAMDRQSKTLTGTISTFNDTINNELIDGLMPSLPVLSETLLEVMPAVGALARGFAQALGPALIQGAELMKAFAPIVSAILPPLFELTSATGGLVAILNALAPVAVAIGKILGGFASAVNMLPGPVLNMIGVFITLRLLMLKLGPTFTAFKVQAVTAFRTASLSSGSWVNQLKGQMIIAKTQIGAIGMAFKFFGTSVMASLRVARTAVAGFMASIGPLGWAIIAASAAFEIFSSNSAAAEATAAELEGQIDSLTGAFTQAGNEAIAFKLRQAISEEDIAALDKYGISVRDMATAIAEGGPALDAMTAKLGEFRNLEINPFGRMGGHDIALSFSQIADGAEMARKSVNDMKASETEMAGAADAAAAATTRHNDVMNMAAVAKERAAIKTATLAAAEATLTSYTQASKAALDLLLGVLSEEASWDTAVASTQALGKALKKGTDYTKNNTEAQREGRAAIRQSIQGWVDYANATNDPIEKQRRLAEGYNAVKTELKKKGIKPKDLDVVAAFDEAKNKTKDLATEWKGAAKDATDAGNVVGKNFIDGVVAALEKNKGAVESAAGAVGAVMPAAANAAQDANSPAKKGIEVGKNFIDGVTLGLLKDKPVVGSTSAAVAGALMSGFKGALKGGGSLADVIDSVYGNVPDMPTPLEAALGKKGSEKWLKKHAKELQAVKAAFTQIDEIRDVISGANEVLADLNGMQQQVSGAYKGERLSVPSAIENALGKDSDLSSAMGMFENLGQSVNQAYDALLSVAPKGERAMLRGAKNATAGYLRAMKDEVAGLMIRKSQVEKALADLDQAHENRLKSIESSYDKLDAAAEKTLRETEARWDAQIKTLQSALDAANKAYDEANKVLESLVGERDGFLKKIADGYRSYVNDIKSSEDGITASSFITGMQDRLKAVKEFGANIRSLLAAGLDPSLVRQFVEAGPQSAGATVAALAGGTAADITAINAAQQALSAEIQGFGETASAQWYDAAIAQQQAVVAPLQATAQAAQVALDQANAARAAEVAAAQAHLDSLKVQRQAAIDAENADYLAQRGVLEGELKTITETIDARAKNVQEYFANLMDPASGLPATTWRLGWEAINGLIRGLNAREGQLLARARQIADAVAATLRSAFDTHSPSRVTARIGEDVAAGLAQGMLAGTGMVENAAGGLVSAADFSGAVNSLARSTGGGGVVVQPGAVQMTFSGSMDSQSADEIREIVDQALLGLAREIRRTS